MRIYPHFGEKKQRSNNIPAGRADARPVLFRRGYKLGNLSCCLRHSRLAFSRGEGG